MFPGLLSNIIISWCGSSRNKDRMSDKYKVDNEQNKWKSLKVVSATFGPITMFKQQSLSFVSKIFMTHRYLVFILSNIFQFFCLYCSCLAHLQPRDIRGKHSFEKKITPGIILMMYANALTRTECYWKQYFDNNTLQKILNK